MYMYIYIYVSVYIHMYEYTLYVYVCIHIHIHISIYIHVYKHTLYVYVCIHTMHAHICIYVFMKTYHTDICEVDFAIEFVICIYTLQHTATHCNTLQHTATHCNTHNERDVFRLYVWINMCTSGYLQKWQWRGTGWFRFIGCLISIGHFSQKSPLIRGSFAENDQQLEASYESSPPSRLAR